MFSIAFQFIISDDILKWLRVGDLYSLLLLNLKWCSHNTDQEDMSKEVGILPVLFIGWMAVERRLGISFAPPKITTTFSTYEAAKQKTSNALHDN